MRPTMPPGTVATSKIRPGAQAEPPRSAPAQRIALRVATVPRGHQDQIDDLPDAEPAAGEQLHDPERGVAEQKAIDAEVARQHSREQHVVAVDGRASLDRPRR